MNRNDVRRFMSNCPHKDFITFLINRVNLTELEKVVIDYKINKNYTDEKVSEVLQKSIEYTHRLVRNTFNKLAFNWQELFNYIVSYK